MTARRPLTYRQREVLRLAATGLLDKEIAVIMGLSVQTIAKHLGRAYQRIGVRNRVEAALWVARQREGQE